MYKRQTLNSSDKVTRIDIEEGSNSTVKGEVTYIKTSGSSKYIEIEKSNGKEVEYDLASSVTVKKGSSTKSLSYVEEGMDVKLTLNSKNDVTKIEIE